MRAALNLAVGVHAGVAPDYFGVAGWWQQQDLSWFAFMTLVLMVRIAAERTGRPVAGVCSELGAARGVVVRDQLPSRTRSTNALSSRSGNPCPSRSGPHDVWAKCSERSTRSSTPRCSREASARYEKSFIVPRTLRLAVFSRRCSVISPSSESMNRGSRSYAAKTTLRSATNRDTSVAAGSEPNEDRQASRLVGPRRSGNCVGDQVPLWHTDRVTTERRTVWVEELDCCGDPFALGSTVAWELHSVADGERRFLRAVFGADTAARITDGYERHGVHEPTSEVVGIVRSIDAVSWQVHPMAADESPLTDALGLYAQPGSLAIEARSAAKAFDWVGGRECFGYIVELDVAIDAASEP